MQELVVDEIYIDKASGKNTDRPQLKKMLSYVWRGDTVIVENISRFALNIPDLLKLIEILSAQEVSFISEKEAIDTNTPAGKFTLTLILLKSKAFIFMRNPRLKKRGFLSALVLSMDCGLVICVSSLNFSGIIPKDSF